MPGPVVYRPPSLADLMRPITGPSPAPSPTQPPVQLPSEPNRPIGKDPLLDIGEAVFGALGIYDPLDLKASSATQIGGMVGAAGLPLIGMAANALKGTRLAKAGQVVRDAAEAEGILAYHGSPHDFDKFSTSAIGTGEGAQVYGRGLYFAQKKGVAQSYRDALSGKAAEDPFDNIHIYDSSVADDEGQDAWGTLTDINKYISNNNPSSTSSVMDKYERGTALADEISDIVNKYGKDREVGDEITDIAVTHYEDLLKKAKAAQAKSKGAAMASIHDRNVQDIEATLKDLMEGTMVVYNPGVAKPGKMYQVRIKTTPDKLLDWDKMLVDQPEVIDRLYPGAKDIISKITKADKEFGANTAKLREALSDPNTSDIRKEALRFDTTQASNRKYQADQEFYDLVGVPVRAYGKQLYRAQVEKRAKEAIKVTELPDGMYEVHDTVNNRKTIERNKVLADSMRAMWAREDPFSHEAAAVDLMKTSGIPGIKYLDGMSRGRGKGTHNFVVFDDNIIDVLKKWGLMLPIGGATLGSLMSPQGGSQ